MIRWSGIDAVLFDLDGVLTPTAEIHERAWKEMFDGFLRRRAAATGEEMVPFSAADYLAFVDGKQRADGVRSFVRSRGIELPEGHATDAPGDATIHALGNTKNDAFQQVLRTDGIAPYPGSMRFLDALDAHGTAVAVVSSSRNAPEVLRAAGLADRFRVVVDGAVAGAEGLAGKPAPDTFLAAAARLGVPAAHAAVVEDALSGVAAGRAGGFAAVVGVDRGAGRDALTANGADVVVTDLAELLPLGANAESVGP
jgi:beta-phosphoglucomutase family hydrolase